MKPRAPVWSLTALIWVSALSAADAASPRIVVGPNILVSRDGDFPHVELNLASNPKNAKNMVGGAITYARPSGGAACRAYATVDGGATWKASDFAEQVEWGGFDPYVAFTPRGTALFAALSFRKDESGRTSALHAYRSEDGGRTWSAGRELGYSYDHPQIAVDQTTGRYSGRAYLAVQYGPFPRSIVGVFRSADDGRSWIGPVDAAEGGGRAVNEVSPLVLSDGSLVLPFADFEIPQPAGKVASRVWTVLSDDGGVSFGKPRRAGTIWYDFGDPIGRRLGGFLSFAADTGSPSYRDRIYAVWPDARFGRMRILFSRSEDRGLHWSAPTPVDASAPPETYQYQSVVAVNKEGVIGVSWYDTRGSEDAAQYHQYFAASTDGGKSFLPSVRVSSAPSIPQGPGNMVFEADVRPDEETAHLSLVSAASKWGNGGDYMGLTVDRDGVFHPFWADARSGTFQIYTARVSVAPASKEQGIASTEASPAPAPRRSGSILDRVEFVFDRIRYDMAVQEAQIPVRLRNTSKGLIYPPITLEIAGFGIEDPELPKDDSPPPAVVNSANGKSGVGATFDFTGALGTLEALEPGAQTSPVLIRLKLEDPMKIPTIRLKLEGNVGSSK